MGWHVYEITVRSSILRRIQNTESSTWHIWVTLIYYHHEYGICQLEFQCCQDASSTGQPPKKKLFLERKCFFLVWDFVLFVKIEFWPNTNLKCHCDEISLFFFPLFLPRITYRHERCPFVQKEKIKKVSFIKISPFEKWNLPSAIARNRSSWARYFRSGNSTCDVIYLTLDWWSLDFRGISVGFWLEYLRNFCRFRSSIWGKFVWKQ